MYRSVTFATGVGRASLAAGPAFLTSIAVFTTLSMPNAIAIGPSSLALLFLLIPAVMVGALLALIPNLVGTALLAKVAGANAGLRLPVAWALVGGLVAGGGAAFEAADDPTIAAFAATGAICALLCRSGTRWPDR